MERGLESRGEGVRANLVRVAALTYSAMLYVLDLIREGSHILSVF